MRTAVQRTTRRAVALVIGLALVCAALPAQAATQRLALRADWNLVSFAVTPDDPTVLSVLGPLLAGDNLVALWAYDASSGIWSRFPAAVPGGPSLSVIEGGRGYWLKLRRAAQLDVEGELGMTIGPDELARDWNLVGFPLEEPTPYDRVITNAAVRQVWTFDAAQGKFLGVVIDPQGTVLREDFINLEAGRGYWLFSNQDISLAPVLGTGLPPDLDLPPLIPDAAALTSGGGPVDELAPKPFTRSEGDIDIAGDGFYDRTGSQRAIDFGERQTIQPVSIFNDRSGVLSWRIEIVDPETTPWLRLRIVDPDTKLQTLVTELSGSVASETDVVDIVVDRTGLPPGQLSGAVKLTTNAAELPPPNEAMRTMGVHMSVAELDGDYRLTANIETINDKPADLPDPRLAISLYRDSDGLKAAVDEAASLLFSHRLRLSGNFVAAGSSRFQVSGSYEMAADDPGNPYGVAVRRDLTLRGQRRDPLVSADATLGPLDLKGEYFETIRNVTETPIYLAGTFIAERLGAHPSARDLIENDNRTAGNIPDSGTLQRTIQVAREVLITELDVTVELQHPRPADLVVTLIGPDNTEAVLRSRSAAAAGRVAYDTFATPVDSLEVFNGKLAAGTYTLRVADQQAGQTGTLRNWNLQIAGTEVHDLGGSIAGVPAGTRVHLTGCGVSAFATTGADGSYSFKNLVDCVYRVTVLQSGFQTVSRDVVLSGGDVTDAALAPPSAPPVMADPVVQPSGDNAAFVSLTTAGGAGTRFPVREQQYVFDATTYDVDRPPVGVGNFPDGPDTNAFLDDVNPLTMSNTEGINGVVDGPAGSNARRVTMAIGLPVIGTSVQGNLRLSVGANP
ncbi:MAG: proprotein convertase P-domain-containing protein [Candidatus Binatia bacterium]